MPTKRLDVPESSWWNSSKICSRFSASIPMPQSETASSMLGVSSGLSPASATLAEITTSPWSCENFTAFDTRLYSTWRTLDASTVIGGSSAATSWTSVIPRRSAIADMILHTPSTSSET